MEFQNSVSAKTLAAIHFSDSELHNSPQMLHETLQNILDGLHCDRVLMALGYCGGSIEGLRTGAYETIIPRVDDCISLLLGFHEKQQLCDKKPTYFLTQGWLNSKRNIWVEYNYCVAKYGVATGEQIFNLMFNNYQRLGVLDAGCYDVSDILAQTEMIAATLKLDHQVIPTTVGNLESLLTGPWTEADYCICPPHSVLSLGSMQLEA